jgi:hypothetical protein
VRAGGGWRGFVQRYGWRAYALPLLLVITVAAVVSMKQEGGGTPRTRIDAAGSSAPPTASPSFTLKHDAPAGKVNEDVLKAAALPAGAPYTMRGTGSYRILPGTSPVVGKGPRYRYSIEVENGITGVNLAQFQDLVVRTLSDPRSWSGHGVSVQRVDRGPIDIHVSLVSALTTRKLCGYTIHVETSCYAAAQRRVVLNVARWTRGAVAYLGDPTAYRIYMINHEDGHAMGHQHAHQCLPGGLAPVMMQQTFGLRSTTTGQLCSANPWPYPPGAKGAPGREQPDTPANDEYGRGD